MTNEKANQVFERRKSISELYQTVDGEVHADYDSAFRYMKRKHLGGSIQKITRNDKPVKAKKATGKDKTDEISNK